MSNLESKEIAEQLAEQLKIISIPETINEKEFVLPFSYLRYFSLKNKGEKVMRTSALKARAILRGLEVKMTPNGKEGVTLKDARKLGFIFS